MTRVILRVIIKVTKNKEEILVLFTEIPSRNIKHQLKLCKKCFNNLRDTNEEEFGNEKSEEETKEEKEEQDVDELEEDEDKKNDDGSEFIKKEKAHRKSQKKFKPYATNIISLLMKFLFFIILIESYFMISYFLSRSFLGKILAQIDEVYVITSRININVGLYSIFQEALGTNGKIIDFV